MTSETPYTSHFTEWSVTDAGQAGYTVQQMGFLDKEKKDFRISPDK
jgi:hypothetical protein